MWADINLDKPLTIGKLRELVNNSELSKFPDSIPVNMVIKLSEKNVIGEGEQPYAPILSILGDNDEINLYNYV